MKLSELFTPAELDTLSTLLVEAEFRASGASHRTEHADLLPLIRSAKEKLFDQLEAELMKDA